MKGFKKSDIRNSGGTAGTFTKVNGRVYRLLVSPTANAAGNIVAAVGEKKARDRAGNGNKAKRRSQLTSSVYAMRWSFRILFA